MICFVWITKNRSCLPLSLVKRFFAFWIRPSSSGLRNIGASVAIQNQSIICFCNVFHQWKQTINKPSALLNSQVTCVDEAFNTLEHTRVPTITRFTVLNPVPLTTISSPSSNPYFEEKNFELLLATYSRKIILTEPSSGSMEVIVGQASTFGASSFKNYN